MIGFEIRECLLALTSPSTATPPSCRFSFSCPALRVLFSPRRGAYTLTPPHTDTLTGPLQPPQHSPPHAPLVICPLPRPLPSVFFWLRRQKACSSPPAPEHAQPKTHENNRITPSHSTALWPSMEHQAGPPNASASAPCPPPTPPKAPQPTLRRKEGVCVPSRPPCRAAPPPTAFPATRSGPAAMPQAMGRLAKGTRWRPKTWTSTRKTAAGAQLPAWRAPWPQQLEGAEGQDRP